MQDFQSVRVNPVDGDKHPRYGVGEHHSADLTPTALRHVILLLLFTPPSSASSRFTGSVLTSESTRSVTFDAAVPRRSTFSHAPGMPRLLWLRVNSSCRRRHTWLCPLHTLPIYIRHFLYFYVDMKYV